MTAIRRWCDSSASGGQATGPEDTAPDWPRIVPFIALHLGCGAVLWVGVSPVAAAVAVASYLLRMLAITGFYHRYFAHRSFRTGRAMQFLFALLGATATQRGPLWWAAHHRRHHRHADRAGDPHRPVEGLLWSHLGWFLCGRNFVTDRKLVRDWARFPELIWLDRFDTLVPALHAALLYLLGALLERTAPGLGTSGAQMLVWGYLVSTVALLHATFLVNSLAHVWGHRRFDTADRSRNNALIALLTLGEGWHNNHHRYPGAARQGFYWWQFDPCYWMLRGLEKLGLVWDLRPVPPGILREGLRS